VATQLTFDLALRPALGREDFLVAPSNRAAVELVDRWPDWRAPAALLVGPPGSGKSHLVEVWRNRAQARLARAGEVVAARVPELMAAGALAIDDAPPEPPDEAAWFHLLNLAREQRGFVLIAARMPPAAWGIALPDLRSRLAAAPAVELGPPDDELLRGVLVKLFADRQLAVDEPLIAYLLARMERSLGAARALVTALDRAALSARSAITRRLIAQVLAETTPRDLFD
jgi:chromosomal replication initiation ATPase DnaA